MKKISLSDSVRMKLNNEKFWIAFGFDGVLVRINSDGSRGDTVGEMVDLLKNILQDDKYGVRILTHHAATPEGKSEIEQWLKDNDLPELQITDKIDSLHYLTLDPYAIQVKTNKGEICGECLEFLNKLESNFSSGLAPLFSQWVKGFF